jgi:hypothetical protein
LWKFFVTSTHNTATNLFEPKFGCKNRFFVHLCQLGLYIEQTQASSPIFEWLDG